MGTLSGLVNVPMWFPDLSPYTYLRARVSSPPTLNVGWLDEAHPFPTGTLPVSVIQRLAVLVEHGSTRVTRGFHICPFCPRTGRGPLDEEREGRGCAEIRVVDAAGVRYAAPTLIHHYVSIHGYRPPQAFVDALMRAAHVGWADARRDDLCISCGCQMRRVSQGEGGGHPGLPFAYVDCETCETSYRR